MAGHDIRSRKVLTGHCHVWGACRGFTMVELIVVMILAGILGAVGVARFFDRGGFDVDAFAGQSRAMLRYAQKVAIAQQREVYVRFDRESISLCFSVPTVPCDAGMQVRAPSGNNDGADSTYCTSRNWACQRRPPTVSYTLSLGVIPAGGSRYVFFDALGRPLDDSGSQQTAGLTLTITADGVPSTQVNVAPDTGYVF